MSNTLDFDDSKYEVKTCTYGDRTIEYRAFENIPYCTAPKAPVQVMNIFAPEVYYHGGSINGYTLKTAPIYAPNTVGGYMEGPADEPGPNPHADEANNVFDGLEHGYVVASAGVRGRTTGTISTEFFEGASEKITGSEEIGHVGKAPAFIVDMKAAVRYLRHNADKIPGDPEKIITNGTSAGGALSALMGASGNCPEYEPYLQEIGAAEERDDIFGALCYCPIHNLENADAAYEWQFCGQNDFIGTDYVKTDEGIRPMPVYGTMTEKQIEVSRELKPLFPAYVNSLGLKDEEGNPLTLDENGEGSFKDYVKAQVMKSAQKELDTHDSAIRLADRSVAGSLIDEQDYLVVEDGKVTDMDWDRYIAKITRMKVAPAFDSLDQKSPENEEFGTEEVFGKHFTEFSAAHTEGDGVIADPELIRIMNPIRMMGGEGTTKNWRVRHGSFDRDTSLAIPTILATKAMNLGYSVDFLLPWGQPHSGDYDMDDQFAWIDAICKK